VTIHAVRLGAVESSLALAQDRESRGKRKVRTTL